MIELLERKTWIIGKEESKEDFIGRVKLQEQQYSDMQRIHGRLFMLLFGEGDVRPMWEDQISKKELIEQVKTPLNTHYECPLCQPYDQWTGTADMKMHRRFMCRVVIPKYEKGCIDEEGVLIKCICILHPKYRKDLKIRA